MDAKTIAAKQQEYLDTGIREVNAVGGPPITRDDFIPPPTLRVRLRAHYIRHKIDYHVACILAAAMMLIGALVMLVRYETVQDKIAWEVFTKAGQLEAEKLKTQRAADIAFIEAMEHKQAPEVEALMNSIFKIEDRFNTITDPEILIARWPRALDGFEDIRTRLKYAEFTRLSPYKEGYLFTTTYEFLPEKDKIEGQKLVCTIHGHQGLKQVDVCDLRR